MIELIFLYIGIILVLSCIITGIFAFITTINEILGDEEIEEVDK